MIKPEAEKLVEFPGGAGGEVVQDTEGAAALEVLVRAVNGANAILKTLLSGMSPAHSIAFDKGAVDKAVMVLQSRVGSGGTGG